MKAILQKSREIACESCDKTFISNYKFKCHVKSKHEGLRFKCENCLKLFEKREKLSIHSCKAIKKEKGCGQCDKLCVHESEQKPKSKDSEFREAKKEEVISIKNVIKCDLCPEYFPNTDLLEEHVLEAHVNNDL